MRKSAKFVMKTISRFCVWLTIAPLITLVLFAENPAKRLVPVQASVGDVVDSRSTGSFNSECKVELKFTGDVATDAATVRQVHVKKAVDELGRDLAREDSSDPFMHSSSASRTGALKTEVRLRNPSRNATVIK